MGTAVEVTTFMNCSPVVLAVVITVAAIEVAAVEAAPNTLPECLRVCLRMTSEDEGAIKLCTKVSYTKKYKQVSCRGLKCKMLLDLNIEKCLNRTDFN